MLESPNTLDRNTQADTYEDQGFLITEETVDTRAVSNFRRVMLSVLQSNLDDSYCGDGSADSILIHLYKSNPTRLTNVQRIISRLPEFYALISNPTLIKKAKLLLNLDEDNALYTISNCIVFDFPTNPATQPTANFHADWHDDTFWSIPNSQFIHVWMPLLHDATEELGALQFCEHSHHDKWLGRHTVNPKAEFNYRYGVREEVAAQYNKITVPVKTGETLFFNSNLIHSSGLNQSHNKVRVTMS